jgi:steroid 5-alpha reductase family enzyme
VTIWGLRLTAYITWRNWARGEDYRYREMRERNGSRFRWTSLVTVFGLQAVLLWIIGLALLPAARGMASWTGWLAWAGMGLWSIGFYFEAVGDWQLARFRARRTSQGRVLDTGLWRYTRHPNYFGDACVWWGFYCFAAAQGAWWAVFSPVVMTLLLFRVSGVSLLEKTLVETKPRYRDSVARTSAFIPWPPRREPQ